MKTLPADFVVHRGQTQRNVNHTVLTALINTFPDHAALQVLDLPCGNLEFLTYLAALFPSATLTGADIVTPPHKSDRIGFVQMDLTRNFDLPAGQQFDLITCISGVMMFGNTLSFVRNCIARLKPGGVFIVTNDNSATIIDRLAYLFFGRYRLFKPLYEDDETLTQYVSIQELCRLLRTHHVAVEDIAYTSFYPKDLVYLPLAMAVYPVQRFYLQRLTSKLPIQLKRLMYPFKHLFCKHYIITGRKAPALD
jgi:2-polyprenyl-3-methyl-5-hydroxy-6-metoxy-1,4-benzoquinol methylase